MKKLLEIIPLLIGTCLLVEMTIEVFTYDPVTPVNVVNYNTVYNIKVIVPHETPEYTEAKFGNNAFLTHIERIGEMGTKSTYTGYCLYCQQQGMVTVEDDVAKEYEESELCGFTFTDDAYLALFELMKRAYDVEHFSCTNPDMPVLFVSGAEDPCLINVRHFAKTVRAMRRAGYKDVKGKLYPGMRHEILNEIGREQVYHDIAVYMRKKGF